MFNYSGPNIWQHFNLKTHLNMNNEAFREMVQKRGPSTKEIARAAVEEEFKKRRKGMKRSRQDDYMSDSDDEGGKKPKKKEVLFRPTQLKLTEKEKEEEQNYRDRAKERRTGNFSTDGSKPSNDDSEIPQSVATKGLDLSQIRKEKAQMRKINEDDSDSSIHETKTSTELPSFEDAQESLERFVANPDPAIPNELSEFVVLYARSKFSIQGSTKKIMYGVEGRILQRTCLVFNPLTHLLDRRKAWEAPREMIQSTASDLPYSPPLPTDVLSYLDRFFPDKNLKHEEASKKTTENCERKATTQRVSNEKSTEPASAQTDDDDDDDIFGGLGDYNPPTGN